MKKIENKLALRIRELREEKGLSQIELAKAVNFTQAFVSSWEAGRRTPNVETIIFLAQFFGVTTDYLLGLED